MLVIIKIIINKTVSSCLLSLYNYYSGIAIHFKRIIKTYYSLIKVHHPFF